MGRIGSYKRAGLGLCEAAHIRAHVNPALSQISPPDHLEELMQEVFSKTADPNVPLHEQDYYELRLDELGFAFRPQFIGSMGTIVRHRFLVVEAHAAWSEIDRNVMWDGFENDECSTLEEAVLRYAIRRDAIADKGFIYSDMEF